MATTEQQQDLVPHLPYDLARDCLLRLPLSSLLSSRAVCKQWKHLLNSPHFYLQRKAQGLTSISLCLLQPHHPAHPLIHPQIKHPPAYALSLYHPNTNTCCFLPPLLPHFPHGLPLFCHCVALQHNLLLLGGWNPVTWVAMPCVYIFDFLSGKWRRGKDMLVTRSFFACGVMGCLVLVAGGHDDNKNALNTAEVYNLELDEWQALPSMSQERDEPKGVVMDQKFYVISGYTTDSQGRFVSSADVFNASTCCWERIENMWIPSTLPAFILSFDGHLLSFQRHQLLKYNMEKGAWEAIDIIPDAIRIAACGAIVREGIFVMGTNGNGEANAFIYEPAKGMNGEGKWKFIKQFHSLGRDACTVEI